MPQDSSFIYHLMISDKAGGRVRFGGATPSPEKVSSSLWDSVLAQWIVERVQSGDPLGLVAVTSPNFRDGYAYVSAIGAEGAHGLGLIVEAVILTVNYAFLTWPFRKIYMEAMEESFRSFYSGLERFFSEEGRLREHTYWNGRYEDVATFAVYRETWSMLAPDIIERLRPREKAQIPFRPQPS